jgi:hypothetical protein
MGHTEACQLRSQSEPDTNSFSNSSVEEQIEVTANDARSTFKLKSSVVYLINISHSANNCLHR